MSDYRSLNIKTAIGVVLTGAIFGALSGLIIGDASLMLYGAVSAAIFSIPVAILYIRSVCKVASRTLHVALTWTVGALSASLGGAVCGALTQGTLIAIAVKTGSVEDIKEYMPAVITFGFIFGAVVGFLLGTILSLIYAYSHIITHLKEEKQIAAD